MTRSGASSTSTTPPVLLPRPLRAWAIPPSGHPTRRTLYVTDSASLGAESHRHALCLQRQYRLDDLRSDLLRRRNQPCFHHPQRRRLPQRQSHRRSYVVPGRYGEQLRQPGLLSRRATRCPRRPTYLAATTDGAARSWRGNRRRRSAVVRYRVSIPFTQAAARSPADRRHRSICPMHARSPDKRWSL